MQMKSVKEKSGDHTSAQFVCPRPVWFGFFFKAMCKDIRKTEEWMENCLWKMSFVLGHSLNLNVFVEYFLILDGTR